MKKITTLLIMIFLFNALVGFTTVQAALNNQKFVFFIMPLENNAPDIPEIPNGPTSFKVGQEQVYTTITDDPEDHDIAYKWDFGDGTITDWSWTSPSGETSWPAEHTWSEEGSYEVKVKAKDDPNGDGDPSDGLESDWSDPLTVSVQKNRVKIIQNVVKSISQIFFQQTITFNPL